MSKICITSTKKVKLSLLLLLFIFVSSISHSQTAGTNDTSGVRSIELSLYGENRNFFMSTINEGTYKDDYALATGIALGLKINVAKRIEAGISSATIFNIFSSDLSEPDPVSGGINRYETGLFDVTRPGKSGDLTQLEDVYLSYKNKSGYIKAGRFVINTPFINPQDGRIRPTYQEGFWFEQRIHSTIKISGGYTTRIMPRSVREWYKPGNSIGLYPSGRDEFGNKSGYPGNIKSNGVATVNFEADLKKNINVSFWNGYIENVLNTAAVEISHNKKVKKDTGTWYQGLILLHQDAVNNGGNSDPLLTYAKKGTTSNAISIQSGYRKGKYNTSINYTHITGDGRYLMPREWGKEMFYTFMPRERSEGAGNVHSFMVQSKYTAKNNSLSTLLGYGYFLLPDISDARLNKYAMPSYHQINLDIIYSFSNILNGLEFRTLIAYKIGSGETYNNPKNVYNKVDILNMNFILSYKL